MAILNRPEYKEWFTVPNGKEPLDKIPQESYIKTTTINNITVPSVFQEKSYPKWEEFKKLFESSLFSLNAEHRAKEQPDTFEAHTNYYGQSVSDIKSGHVTVSTDKQAVGLVNDLNVSQQRDNIGKNGNTSRYTRVPRVSQLPTVGAIDNYVRTDWPMSISDNVASSLEVDVDPDITTRNHFEVKLSNSHIDWLKTSFDSIKTYVDTEISEITGVDDLDKFTWTQDNVQGFNGIKLIVDEANEQLIARLDENTSLITLNGTSEDPFTLKLGINAVIESYGTASITNPVPPPSNLTIPVVGMKLDFSYNAPKVTGSNGGAFHIQSGNSDNTNGQDLIFDSSHATGKIENFTINSNNIVIKNRTVGASDLYLYAEGDGLYAKVGSGGTPVKLN